MLYEGLDIYEAKIENATDGIVAISLVEYPAVESNFVCFNQDREIQKFAIENEDKHLITGVIMLANSPIYRRDGDYEFYITYSPETIQLMASKMLNDGTFKLNDIQHNGKFIKGLSLVELYIKDEAKGINPSFLNNIPDGSLLATYHCDDDELWNEIKNGDMLNGFSLEGYFGVQKLNNQKQKHNIMNIIEKFMKKLIKFSEINTDKGILLIQDGEAFEVGVEVYVEVDGEWVSAEDGEYRLDDDRVVVIADGKIAEIREKEVEEPVVEEEVVVEAEDEVIVEEPVEPQPDERDVYQEQIDALKAEIAELREEIEALRNSLAEIVKTPAAPPVVEEFSKVTENPKGLDKRTQKTINLLSSLKK